MLAPYVGRQAEAALLAVRNARTNRLTPKRRRRTSFTGVANAYKFQRGICADDRPEELSELSEKVALILLVLRLPTMRSRQCDLESKRLQVKVQTSIWPYYTLDDLR